MCPLSGKILFIYYLGEITTISPSFRLALRLAKRTAAPSMESNGNETQCVALQHWSLQHCNAALKRFYNILPARADSTLASASWIGRYLIFVILYFEAWELFTKTPKMALQQICCIVPLLMSALESIGHYSMFNVYYLVFGVIYLEFLRHI